MSAEHAYMIVGRMGAPHGVRGWIKVNSFTQPTANLLNYQPWYIAAQDTWQPLSIERSQPHGKQLILKLKDCDDRDQAALFTNQSIAITRDQLADLPSDEFYWSDLEGLRVYSLEGKEYGVVDHLISTGANDVLVVKGELTRMIPYIDHVVKEVNLADKKIIVDWHHED